MQGAVDAAKKARNMYPKVLRKENELVSTREMRKILTDYSLMFRNEVLEMDLTKEESEIIWKKYLEIRKVVNSRGVKWLLDYSIAQLEKLIEYRADLVKGRKHASPLPWWKIAVIAVSLAVSISAVVYCYKKHDCRWVWNMVKAIGGALWEMLKSGC